MLEGAVVVLPARVFDVPAAVFDGYPDAVADVPEVAVPYAAPGADADCVFDELDAVFDVPDVVAVPYAVVGVDVDCVFDVPYVLLVFAALLVCVPWLVDPAVFVLPCARLIMSFQLVVEHPPSATTSAPATAVMRNFDVLI